MIAFMKIHFLRVMSIAGVCLLNSCANNQPIVEEEKDEVILDKMVARVASVNRAAEYVLIQRFGRLVIPEDSILYTLGSTAPDSNNVASIRVTGEKLGQFLAADIISGELTVGDTVYLRNFEKKDDVNSQ